MQLLFYPVLVTLLARWFLIKFPTKLGDFESESEVFQQVGKEMKEKLLIKN